MRVISLFLIGLLGLNAQEFPSFPWDPIALTQGVQVAGSALHQTTHAGYAYRFKDAASRAKFQADPGRYAIQLGGACARMGILSGKGNPDRFAVHNGRIYIFASDSCRATFLKDPTRVLETLDAWREPSPKDRTEAQRRLALAARAHGGPDALRAVRTITWERKFQETSGGKTYQRRRAKTLTAPGGVTFEDAWDDSIHRLTVNPEETPAEVDKTSDGLSGEQRAWVRRIHRWHEPLALLAAALEGKAQIAPGEGQGLRVHIEGVTTGMDLDPDTHRVVRTTFRGWTKGFLGTVEQRHSGFQKIGPLVLATVVEADGKPAPWTTILVDGQRWPQ